MNIGKAIRTVRLRRDMTQQELSSRANITVPYVSLIERSERDMNFLTLKRIAVALDISLVLLLFLAADNDELDALGETTCMHLSGALVRALRSPR